MKKSILLFTLIIITASNSFGQAAGNSVYNESAQNYYVAPVSYKAPKTTIYKDSTLELSVDALMNVDANSYVVILGSSQVGETIDSCYRGLNDRINNFINQLLAIGIKKEDLYVDFVSQVPVFEYEVEKKVFSKKYNEVPKGYELKKNIHVGYKKNEDLDKILFAATKNEIYDVVKVDYIIDNMKAIYDSLRNISIKAINAKADDFKKLGIKFSSARFEVVAEDMSSTYPVQHYKSYTAFNNSSIVALKKSTPSEKIIQAPKATTVYYNKLPYDNFEIVINPKVIEPCAQFIYSLKVRYTFIREGKGNTTATTPR